MAKLEVEVKMPLKWPSDRPMSTASVPTTESRVREVLGREGFLEDDYLTSSSLEDDIGMDSLDKTEFALGLEAEFDFETDLGDEDDWITLLDVVQYVDERLVR